MSRDSERAPLAASVAVLVLSALLLASCGNATVGTPAPPTPVDLTIARALLDVQTVIDKARPMIATTPAMKDPLNIIIASYNTAETAFVTFEAQLKSGTNPDPAALQAQIVQLTGNVSALVSKFGVK